MSVTVVDSGEPGCATSAHCEGNVLVSDKPPGPELDLAKVSARIWRDLSAQLADELGPQFPDIEYEPKGGLMVVSQDGGVEPLHQFAAAHRQSGVKVNDLTEAQWRGLEPELGGGIVGAIHYPDDAQIQPVNGTLALLASARRAGAQVRAGAEVTGGLRAGDGRLAGVRTTAGDVPAGAVVVAAGPWSGEVARRLGVPMAVAPRRGMVLVTMPLTPGRVRHKVYAGDYVAATQSGGAAVSAVVESTRAGTVLIGSSRERVGFDPTARVELWAEIAKRAVGLFPFLADVQVMRAYLGFRPYVPDHLPVIGAAGALDGLWFATGHEGAGVGLAPATGDLLAALMLGNPPPTDPTPFSPNRPALTPHPDDDEPHHAGAGAAGVGAVGLGGAPSGGLASGGGASLGGGFGFGGGSGAVGGGAAGAARDADGPGLGGEPALCGGTGSGGWSGGAGTDGTVVVEVDGRVVEGRAGQSIAGLLLAAGEQTWRTTASGARRGLFCGIGVCFDCLVTLNGQPGVRACQRLAVDGDRVVTTGGVG
jgi:glycine/D-amino acid oxidase-like deaminating enzyme